MASNRSKTCRGRQPHFPLWRPNDNCWKREVDSLGSPVINVARLPICWTGSTAQWFQVPPVSVATGWKMCVLANSSYFAILSPLLLFTVVCYQVVHDKLKAKNRLLTAITDLVSASEMTYKVLAGALNSTHSVTHSRTDFVFYNVHHSIFSSKSKINPVAVIESKIITLINKPNWFWQ